MSDTFRPNASERAALTHRLMRSSRAVSRVFVGFGLAVAAIVFMVGQLISSRAFPLEMVMSVFMIPPVLFGMALYARGRVRVRRLLAGTLTRGVGRITGVDPASDGGPTRVAFAITLADGGAATGSLNTYHLADAKIDDALPLWIAADGGSFFPAEDEVHCDPGTITP